MKSEHYERRPARRWDARAGTRAYSLRPPETLIEKLTRDLEAWRLAKGVIARAKGR